MIRALYAAASVLSLLLGVTTLAMWGWGLGGTREWRRVRASTDVVSLNGNVCSVQRETTMTVALFERGNPKSGPRWASPHPWELEGQYPVINQSTAKTNLGLFGFEAWDVYCAIPLTAHIGSLDDFVPVGQPLGHGRRVWVSVWLPLVLGTAWPLVLIVRRLGWSSRITAGLCARCGYDLRASKGRCPECGMPIPAKS